MAGCVATGSSQDDPDELACEGSKCGPSSPDAGIDAGPTSAGSAQIDGVVHSFSTGIARTADWNGPSWFIDLDNWTPGPLGTHTEGVSIAMFFKTGSQLAPGTYLCGLDGPTTAKVSLGYYAHGDRVGTDSSRGGSCSVTITTVPTTIGESLALTFDATIVDDTRSIKVVDGAGTTTLVEP